MFSVKRYERRPSASIDSVISVVIQSGFAASSSLALSCHSVLSEVRGILSRPHLSCFHIVPPVFRRLPYRMASLTLESVRIPQGVSFCDIERLGLPECSFEATHLFRCRRLDISNSTGLTRLTENSQVQWLFAADSDLQLLPPGVECLDICGCYISFPFPSNIRRLECRSASNTCFELIQQNATTLEHLNVSYCDNPDQLDKMGPFPNLVELNVAYSHISVLPLSPRLKTIDISGTEIMLSEEHFGLEGLGADDYDLLDIPIVLIAELKRLCPHTPVLDLYSVVSDLNEMNPGICLIEEQESFMTLDPADRNQGQLIEELLGEFVIADTDA